MKLYALALLFSSHTMTNSSWTQAHIARLLHAGRSSWASTLMAFDDPQDRDARVLAMHEAQVQVRAGAAGQGDAAGDGKEQLVSADPPSLRRWTGCEVVYPPCDTAELEKCGRLDKRERVIVSLAQFRWVQCISRSTRSSPCRNFPAGLKKIMPRSSTLLPVS